VSTLLDLVYVVIRPRRTCRRILPQETLASSLSIVLVFGAVVGLLFLRSHLVQDYPPPSDELETWIETWGEFAMLPVVKIPAERYRLAQAIVMVPFSLAVWLLMAGSASVLSALFRGRTTFVQYANLFGHSFYAFWILATLADLLYSSLMGEHVLRALRFEYGALARALAASYPTVMWTGAVGLGAIYNGIMAHESEGTSLLKAALVAITTGVWPIVLISVLIR
jgi:hypothetical protein